MMISLSSFDNLIASRSLLRHPFYLKWSKGELTQEDLVVYAKEYYHLVKHVPGLVSRIKDRVSDKDLRAKIEENEREEKEHIALWERFALSLGVSDQELAQYQPSTIVCDAVATLEAIMEKSAEEGIAAMYALERELPAIAATKKEGLLKFYGLSSTDAHAYFDEHLGEEKHLEVWRVFPVRFAEAKSAVERSLDAQHKVLDAVCVLRGISLECATMAA
jgi:pyrroloquinoline-quinone synthase